jgi:threonine 3-dehydrogenase
VFHLAAILSARGEADPQRTYAVNQTGTLNLLEACRQQEVRQVLFTSTIAAFGPPLPEPVGDDVALKPTTMYGVTKVAGELLGAYYNTRYGLDFRAVRFPGLISAVLPGGGTSDYAPLMYYESLRDRPLRGVLPARRRDPADVHARRAARPGRALRRPRASA